MEEKFFRSLARSLGVPREQITDETPIAVLARNWEDWVELGLSLEEDFGRDLDMSEWDELGGSPAPHRNISRKVRVRDVWRFLCEQPPVTVDRVVKKAVADFKHISDVSLLPADFRVSCTPKQWLELRVLLEHRCLSMNLEFDHAAWNALGREATSAGPYVRDIVMFVEEAYTADVC